MNIENHFYNADSYLEVAKDMVTDHDYDGALSSLGKAYSNVRELMLKVESLRRNASSADCSAEEDTG